MQFYGVLLSRIPCSGDFFFLVPMGDVIIIESRFVHHWKGKICFIPSAYVSPAASAV